MTPAEILKAMVEAAQAMSIEPQQEQFKIEFLGSSGSGQNAYRVIHVPCPESCVSYQFTTRLNDKLTLWSDDDRFNPDEARVIASVVAERLGWTL